MLRRHPNISHDAANGGQFGLQGAPKQSHPNDTPARKRCSKGTRPAPRLKTRVKEGLAAVMAEADRHPRARCRTHRLIAPLIPDARRSYLRHARGPLRLGGRLKYDHHASRAATRASQMLFKSASRPFKMKRSSTVRRFCSIKKVFEVLSVCHPPNASR
jgi:hypothetical protein